MPAGAEPFVLFARRPAAERTADARAGCVPVLLNVAVRHNGGTKDTVALADEMFKMVNTFAPDLELKYNKFYIGLAKDGQPNNFVILKAKKTSFPAEIRLASSPDIDKKLESADIDVMDYDQRWGRYRLRLTKNDIKKHSDLLLKLLQMSYGLDVGSTAMKAKT